MTKKTAKTSPPQPATRFGVLTLIFIFATLTQIQAQTLPIDSSPPTGQSTKDKTTSKNTVVKKPAILPDGYQISGRKAKLIKLPDDKRWFLAFDEALANFDQQMPSVTPSESGASEVETPDTFQAGNEPLPLPVSLPGNLIPPDFTSGAGDGQLSASVSPWGNPMGVLPGKWLTAMTNVVNNRLDMSIDFRIWGEVTTYHNRNYVLPRFVATLSLFGQESVTANASKGLSALESSMGMARPGVSGATEKDSKAKIKNNSKLPENLRQALLAIPRTRPVELSKVNGIGSQTSSINKKRQISGLEEIRKIEAQAPIKGWSDTQPKLSQMIGAQSKWNDGYIVIDRVGRILHYPGTNLWLFVFEADGVSLAQPPVLLHPCQLLEVAEQVTHQTTEPIKYRITGQISKYQGQSYMLLRKALIVYDMGNLGK